MSKLAVKTDLPDLSEATALSAEDKSSLRDVTARIRGVAPEAELLMYGSRARGGREVGLGLAYFGNPSGASRSSVASRDLR